MQGEVISQQALKEILSYNPDTGIFTWIKSPRPGWVNKVAGYLHETYIDISINRKAYKAHRLAWLYIYGNFPDCEIDHVNLNRTDNRISNLRLATEEEQASNKSRYKNNKSGVKGVYKDSRYDKWIAVIYKDRRSYYIGSFELLEDAAEAIKIKREELHGAFCNHG